MKQTKLYYRIGSFINIGIPQNYITAETIGKIFAVVASRGDVLVHETDWDNSDEGAVLWFVIDFNFPTAASDWLVAALRNEFDVTIEGTY